MPLDRKDRYSPDIILPLIGKGNIILDGDEIHMNGYRLYNFLFHGLMCIVCGIEGDLFIKERSYKKDRKPKGIFHLNLYAIINNSLRLMTADHIVPKKVGGSNQLDNLQVMCSPCNNHKADSLPNPT